MLSLGGNVLTGPVPPELGNLGTLEYLYLNQNLLSGPLPHTMIRVPLRRFSWNRTKLCAPADDEFQRWLASIPFNEGNSIVPAAEAGSSPWTKSPRHSNGDASA
ncbi:MAG: hypothetical protein OXT70_13635, partial [Chloroflexota bacterium]|nr:hypothetical protein [Chloroflexota bacterium]